MADTGAGMWCPNAYCRAAVPAGAEACPTCGLALTGPEAERLLDLDRQLAGLWAESQRLTAHLLPATAQAPAPAPAPGNTTGRAPGRQRRRVLSGQQLLLGLGAVLTLSAASFFLFVVWDLIGPAGQLLAVAILIGAAVWSSYVACRRGLSAAAETAAVLAAGLTGLALAAAYDLGWLGLDRLEPGIYGALAAGALGLLLLLADRGAPGGSGGSGGPAIHSYRPLAAAALGIAPWYLLAGVVPGDESVPVVLGLLGVAVADAAGAAAALRLEPRRTRRGPPATAVVLGVGAGAAYALHLLLGWVAGYDEAVPTGSRVAIACALLLAPALLAMLAARRAAPWLARPSLPAATLALATPSLGILLTDLPHQALVLLTAALALAGLADSMDRRSSRPGWRRAVAAYLTIAVPVLALLVLWLDLLSQDALFDATGDGPGVLASVTAVGLWALAAGAGAIGAYRRGAPTALLLVRVAATEVAVALTAGRVLVEDDTLWGWLIGGLLALVAHALGAAALVRRRRGDPRTVPLEGVLLLGAAVSALVSVEAADSMDDRTHALTLVAVGVVVLAYAALPGRLGFSYLGAVAVSLGSNLLVEEAGVRAVEATSLPLAVLLAGIGMIQARRHANAPTMRVAGPALSVALLPTLAVALESGDDVRLAVVTAAAIGVLGVGLWRQWRAPVTAGAGVLIVVALTQGGPLVGELPTVLVLGVAGGVLLGAGVAWERSVLAGRRAAAWYASLR